MSLIARIVLLVLAIPLVLATGDSCGQGQFRCVFLAFTWRRDVLSPGIGGTPKTPVFPKEGQVSPPPHPPTPTVPSTGRGTLERVAALPTSHRILFLLLSALRIGIGVLVDSAATLRQPLLPPSPLLRLAFPERKAAPERMRTVMMTRTRVAVTKVAMTRVAMARVATAGTVTASAPTLRSVNTVLAMFPLALRVSLLALSQA